MTGTLHEDQCKCTIFSPLNIFIMQNISDKVLGKIKTLFVPSNFFFQKFRAVYEVKLEKNIVQPDRPQMKIQGMRIV
jgi:hypothetical protein